MTTNIESTSFPTPAAPKQAPTQAKAELLMAGQVLAATELKKLQEAYEATPEFAAVTAALEAAQATPAYRAWKSQEATIASERADIKTLFEGTQGVITTAYGKVGVEPRRTVVIKPESVRAHAPDLAGLTISEVVDRKALESMVKAAVKNKKLGDDTWTKIEAEADVTVTTAWIFQPSAPKAPAVEGQPS